METMTFKPVLDIVENDLITSLYFEMPGVRKNAIDYSIDKSNLNVNGLVIKHLGKKVAGRYHRNFKLSNPLDVSKIDVSKEEGRVVFNLPKILKIS
ncbi:MAG: hypothetical protein GY786_18630 [Proteobacteria bacterium]|nr:hypothetical protein [Pseudomonadota bacterium]